MANYRSWRTGFQIDNIYPIGSIYMSVNPTDPSELFGGAWQAIENTFLVAQGSSFPAESTGGTTTHTHTQVATTSGGPSNNTSGGPSTNTSGSTAITTAQMPSHAHEALYWYGTGQRFGVNTTGSCTYRISYTVGAAEEGWRTGPTGSGQGHTHTLSSHTHSLQSHTHSTSATTTGSGNNLPPYLAVYMWQRIS